MVNACGKCKHSRPIPGDCHISCANPMVDMKTSEHGRMMGWCMYPINFDPIWLQSKCPNFEERG